MSVNKVEHAVYQAQQTAGYFGVGITVILIIAGLATVLVGARNYPSPLVGRGIRLCIIGLTGGVGGTLALMWIAGKCVETTTEDKETTS